MKIKSQLTQLLHLMIFYIKKTYLLAFELVRASHINRDLDWTLKQLGMMTFKNHRPQVNQQVNQTEMAIDQKNTQAHHLHIEDLCEKIKHLQHKMEHIEDRIHMIKNQTAK